MGQVLHGSATTTEAIRRAIQARQESVRAAAKRYGLSPTTVQKWRVRKRVADARMGPRQPRSGVLSVEDEAVVVAFRRHTLLPLDDGLSALQPTIPHLTRPSLHRCLQRHGIGRLPHVDGDKPKRSKFKAYPVGSFPIDIAQVGTERGRLRLFAAIDRTSEFAFVRLHDKATQRIAAAFLRDLVAAVPYTIHTVLTDNGIQFADNHPVGEETEAKAEAYRATQDGPRLCRWHSFAWACAQTKIEHRLTKPRCPWTNGQVERMDRAIKDATVKRYLSGSHDELRQQLRLFVDAYDYGRWLRTLRGLTPYAFVCQAWTKQPDRFRLDPSHHMPGPNIDAAQREALKVLVEQGPMPAAHGVVRRRLVDLVQILFADHGVSVSEQTLSRVLRGMGHRKRSARPRRHAQDPDAIPAFQKSSPTAWRRSPRRQGGKPIEIWFADEARVGQKNTLTRRWAKRGTRPSAPKDQRTASAHIFGAICPAKGTGAGLVLPRCTTEAMSLPLAEIARTVAPGAHAVLLRDQAGWHTTKTLAVPADITLLPPPARSPELNPVESLRRFMRDDWLGNRIFKSYADILDQCCDAWRRLLDRPWRIMSIRLRAWAHGS